MHLYMQKLKNRKIPISFQFFCNIPNVICSHLPFVSIYYNVTLFIFEYVHKIIPDPPLVISPPLCTVREVYEQLINNKNFGFQSSACPAREQQDKNSFYLKLQYNSCTVWLYIIANEISLQGSLSSHTSWIRF